MSEKCKKCRGTGQTLRGFKRETDGKFVEIVEPCSLCHARRSPLLAKVMGLAVLALVACGDNKSDPAPYLWGDVAAEISSSYCWAAVGCGLLPDSDVDRCYRHNYSHLCELDETCFEKLPEEARDDVAVCSEALAGLDIAGCAALQFGLVPEGCFPAFEWNPAEN